jgi:hypothetical protein
MAEILSDRGRKELEDKLGVDRVEELNDERRGIVEELKTLRALYGSFGTFEQLRKARRAKLTNEIANEIRRGVPAVVEVERELVERWENVDREVWPEVKIVDPDPVTGVWLQLTFGEDTLGEDLADVRALEAGHILTSAKLYEIVQYDVEDDYRVTVRITHATGKKAKSVELVNVESAVRVLAEVEKIVTPAVPGRNVTEAELERLAAGDERTIALLEQATTDRERMEELEERVLAIDYLFQRDQALIYHINAEMKNL